MTQYTTKQGLEKLKKELDQLKTVEMKKIAELIKHTAEHGDLKENAAYHDAKEKQAFLQGKILELEKKIRNSEIVEKKQDDKIQIGSKVLIFLDEKREKIEIVSPGQSDTLSGKISYESPLGKALLNKSAGDNIKISIEGNEINCRILEIE